MYTYSLQAANCWAAKAAFQLKARTYTDAMTFLRGVVVRRLVCKSDILAKTSKQNRLHDLFFWASSSAACSRLQTADCWSAKVTFQLKPRSKTDFMTVSRGASSSAAGCRLQTAGLQKRHSS